MSRGEAVEPAETVQSFHNLFYNSNIWRSTYWHDTPVLKCPPDLWIYQKLM